MWFAPRLLFFCYLGFTDQISFFFQLADREENSQNFSIKCIGLNPLAAPLISLVLLSGYTLGGKRRLKGF